MVSGLQVHSERGAARRRLRAEVARQRLQQLALALATQAKYAADAAAAAARADSTARAVTARVPCTAAPVCAVCSIAQYACLHEEVKKAAQRAGVAR
eukprot:358384-Chlamydomonas_euryale.AAC.1